MFNEKVSSYLTEVFKYGVLAVALLTIFFFWNLTTEFYETPKFLALAAFIAILLILSTLKYISEGRVVLKLTPLDLPLLGLVAIAALSSLVSPAKYISLLGNAPKTHGSLISLIVYVLLYFLLVNNLKRLRDVKPVITTLVLGGAVAAIISLLSFAGIKVLPFSWAQGLNFTTTGSSFSTSALLAILLPFPVINLLRQSNPAEKLINIVVASIYTVTIALIGSTATFAAAAFALITGLILSNKDLPNPRILANLAVPIALTAVVIILTSIPPLGKAVNPFYAAAKNFPREITLPLSTSWNISVSAFRDSPFIGTGPATYLFDFTAYKPANVNSSQFWNIRFDSGFNEYLQILATLGGIGLGLSLVLTLVFITSAAKTLNEYRAGGQNSFEASLAVAGVTFFVLLALHSSTLVTSVVGIIILAAFMSTNPSLTKELRVKLGAQGDVRELDIFPAILLLIILGLTGLGSFFIGKFALADYSHRLALEAVNKNNGLETYNQLVRAETLNPYNDLYRTDLAQTNFALANAIASAKGPTPSSPAGSLTDADRQNIQQLLQQAINEGKNATAISPRSAGNWEVLGSIYRQVSGVATNALQFALDAYGRAIQLDPLNPILRLNVGGIYYSNKSYEAAVRFFTDAVNLKPDYANGYYNLSIALRDKGDLSNAQATAEKMVSLVDPKSPDYKVASEYLQDLKDRIATGSAQQSSITPPAATQTSPLQQNQQKVLNLPKPENIATPPAVKK